MDKARAEETGLADVAYPSRFWGKGSANVWIGENPGVDLLQKWDVGLMSG